MNHMQKGYWPTWITALLFFVAFYILLVPLPVYLAQEGLPDWQIGLILGTLGVASLIARPLSGILADRWGFRPGMLVGAISLTMGAIGIGFTTEPFLLFLLRILQAVGYVAFTTSATALVASLAPAPKRGAALAVFGVAANVAITFTPGIVSMGLVFLTLKGAFWLSGALAAACGIFAICVLPHTISETNSHPSWRNALKIPKPLMIPMLVTGIFGVGYGAFLQFLPLLTTRRNLDSSGMVYAVYGISIILTRLVTGRFIDEHNRIKVLLPAFLLLTLGLVGFAFTTSTELLWFCAVLLAISSGILHPILIALHVDCSSASERGQATSLFYLGFDMGIGFGTWFLSPVLQWLGLTGLYVFAAMTMVIGMLCLRPLRAQFEMASNTVDHTENS
jgi:MFS family permease